MKQVDEHTIVFRDIVQQTLEDMLGTEIEGTTEVKPLDSVVTKKKFIISIHYTGTVFGEYLLAMDEETAANLIEFEGPLDESNYDEFKDEICDTLSEILNVVVGEAVCELQKSFAKLTITAPRVFFGEIRYPHFRTGFTSLLTNAGEIECHFCLDLMRLNLAESYNDAMASLLEINRKLKDANQQLAEQQAQLVHSEKMASIGILAAGVAHEINTPLFAVDVNLATLDDYVSVMESTIEIYESLATSLGSSETAKLDALDKDDDEEDLEFILEDTKSLLAESRESTKSIKTIVKKLKDFAILGDAASVTTDLNQLAENVISLLNDQLDGQNVECEFADIPEISCNPGEIGQVIINLLLNSVHACDANCNEIKVSTSYQDGSVLLTVSDNGCGIKEEDIGRVFDPFFTTKGVGEGTGLGLSVSFGIARKHDGSLNVESEVGEGTSVTITLPAVKDAVCC